MRAIIALPLLTLIRRERLKEVTQGAAAAHIRAAEAEVRQVVCHHARPADLPRVFPGPERKAVMVARLLAEFPAARS